MPDDRNTKYGASTAQAELKDTITPAGNVFINIARTATLLPSATYIEWLRFAAHRLEAQAKLIDDLAHSDGVTDFVEKQGTFVREAADEYRDEILSLTGKANQATQRLKAA